MCFQALNCSAQFNEHIEDLQGEHTFSLVMVAEERGETDKGSHHHQFRAAPWEVSAVWEGMCAQQAAKSWSAPWICHSVAECPWTYHSSLSFLICKLGMRVFFSTHKIYNVWSESESAQSCPTLWDPVDHTVHGILQARILEWVAFPFSRGSSQPRDPTQVSRTAGGFFTSWVTKEAQEYWSG